MDRIGARIASSNLQRVRHWFGRVTHVFIEGVGRVGWHFERECSTGAKVQGTSHRLLWRPGIEAPPLMSPGLENMRFGHGVISIPFQEMPEKWELDLLAIIFRRLGAEV